MPLHGIFEALGWLAAIGAFWWTKRRYFETDALPLAPREYPIYLLLLWVGAVAGAYALGSANLALGGVAGTARSILGAILGGILVAEPYKVLRGIRGSTGAVFVLPLAAAIGVGRIGCFLAGLADHTYGTPTSLPWGVDFGDGLSRHPVQLYESLAMLGFAAGFVGLLERRRDLAVRRGFYLFALVYGAQRFLWEFLKPYATVAGPLNLFHLASLALALYALVMLRRTRPADARTQPARL
jgi:prolipoprotein diacylglyceryltransferase